MRNKTKNIDDERYTDKEANVTSGNTKGEKRVELVRTIIENSFSAYKFGDNPVRIVFIPCCHDYISFFLARRHSARLTFDKQF